MKIREKSEDAYDIGWEDGYNDEMYCNPYNKETEFGLWVMYDMGFGDGVRES